MNRNKERVKIIQGGKISFVTQLFSGQTQEPYNLTGMFDIQTCFLKDDGTELMLSLVSGDIEITSNPLFGKITITIDAADTALLRPLILGTLEISLIATDGADPVKTQIPEAYDVLQTVC